MVSTYDEFVLLLKKWKTKSTNVSIVGHYQDQYYATKCVFHIDGMITNLDVDKATFAVAGGNNFVMITFAACRFIYEGSDVNLASLTNQQYEEVALLLTPSNIRLGIYVFKSS